MRSSIFEMCGKLWLDCGNMEFIAACMHRNKVSGLYDMKG